MTVGWPKDHRKLGRGNKFRFKIGQLTRRRKLVYYFLLLLAKKIGFFAFRLFSWAAERAERRQEENHQIRKKKIAINFTIRFGLLLLLNLLYLLCEYSLLKNLFFVVYKFLFHFGSTPSTRSLSFMWVQPS